MRGGSPLMNSTRHVVQRALPPQACRMSTPGVLLDREHQPLAGLDINGGKPFNGQLRHARYVNVSTHDHGRRRPTIPRPSQLWKQLSPERKQQAAEAFWRDDNAAVEQAEAMPRSRSASSSASKSVHGDADREEGAAPGGAAATCRRWWRRGCSWRITWRTSGR